MNRCSLSVVDSETMDQLGIISMFLLGLSSTGHCLGMCGPLILAFPAATGRFSSHLFYHLGRMITYAGVGFIMGYAGTFLSILLKGAGADPLLWMSRVQVTISVIAAGWILLFGMARLGFLREPAWMSLASPSGIPGYRPLLDSVARKKSNTGMLLLGAMFGLLPCGLSFGAFARALGAAGGLEGGILSLTFGAGTLPGLLLLGTGLSRLASRYRRHSEILSGAIMIGIGASLLASAFRTLYR